MFKKLLATALFLATSALGAVSATAQWDVQPGGNDSNGGFFNGSGSSPGTDFSQQNAAQLSFADLASANASTTCVVTSASHNFVAADNRNAIHISAGTNWTTGWYEIIAVSANAATLDRACGSVASVSSGTWVEGGRLATINGAATATNGARGSSVQVNVGTVNIQTATYTLTTSAVIGGGGMWQGYQTSHGDNGNPPTITTATNSTELIDIGTSGNGLAIIFDNFIFSNTAATPAPGLVSTCPNSFYLGVRNSSFSGFTNGINADNVGAHCEFITVNLVGVEIKNSTGAGVLLATQPTSFSCTGCWIHNNTGAGLQLNGATSGGWLTVINSLITNNGGKGVDSRGYYLCVNSSIASNTGDGVGAGANGAEFDNVSCIYYGNGGFGVNSPASGAGITNPYSLSRNQAYGSNTSGARNNFNAGLSDVALTANPFTSSTNFALNSTAGGGAAASAAGWPGAFPGGSTTGTINIGAVQAASGGGGGSSGTGHMNSITLASFQ